ncbi:methyltransferase family protein [Solirubrobacter soli]|uniref:methyltransferase family protein n=1 Tax=Solirubrobacter soli TaxID=363832 RepID=UPI000402350F|nr:isoprenylcysteine carboxylmethyltransferase family protein [Solirubrobacter soli]
MAQITLAAWALLEVGVRVWEVVRGKGRRAHDRGTRVLVALSLGAAIGVVFATRSAQPARTAGVVVMWLGLALRVWAIAALGTRFRTTVEVDADQTVITTGPYRWIRHPSYAGLLLIVGGLGLALGTWLSFAAAVLIPLPALVWRMRVEEAELNRVLGDAYATYQAGTARLIPRVW